MNFKKFTLILSLALFAQHANAMENSLSKRVGAEISAKNKKIKQNEIGLIDILPAEIIAATIGWCINLSEDENALAKNITSLLRVNKSFNELINQYPEILKTVLRRFEQIKKNYFAQHNLNYEFMTHRLTPNAKTLLSKTNLLSKIKAFKINKKSDGVRTKCSTDMEELFFSSLQPFVFKNKNNGLAILKPNSVVAWLALCNGAENISLTEAIREADLNYDFGLNLSMILNQKLGNDWSSIQNPDLPSEIVHMLIDRGADVNEADEEDCTPLFEALRNDSDEKVVKALLERGANPNIRFLSGLDEMLTPLCFADNVNVAKLLIENGADVFALFIRKKNSWYDPKIGDWQPAKEWLETAYDYLNEYKILKENGFIDFIKSEMNKQCLESLGNKDEKFDCPICLERINFDTELGFKTQCNHVFHKDCILPWIKEHRNCPLCRTAVTNIE